MLWFRSEDDTWSTMDDFTGVDSTSSSAQDPELAACRCTIEKCLCRLWKLMNHVKFDAAVSERLREWTREQDENRDIRVNTDIEVVSEEETSPDSYKVPPPSPVVPVISLPPFPEIFGRPVFSPSVLPPAPRAPVVLDVDETRPRVFFRPGECPPKRA